MSFITLSLRVCGPSCRRAHFQFRNLLHPFDHEIWEINLRLVRIFKWLFVYSGDVHILNFENHPIVAARSSLVLLSLYSVILYWTRSLSFSTIVPWTRTQDAWKFPKSIWSAAFSFTCVSTVVLRIQNDFRVTKFRINISSLLGSSLVSNSSRAKFLSKWIGFDHNTKS